jgi:hypothetical protein
LVGSGGEVGLDGCVSAGAWGIISRGCLSREE